MRYLLLLSLFATACTGLPSSGPHYDSVRERLSAAPASLYIHDDSSSGAITARRRGANDSWITGTTAITIDHGYTRAAIDRNGELEIDQLEITLAPIALDGVFSKPAALHDVQLRLVEAVRSEAAWSSDDDVTATVVAELEFDWSISFDGGEPYPLATQRLPAESVEVVLAGDGEHVEATLELDAAGVLWNWADLVQITEVSLSLDAGTVD